MTGPQAREQTARRLLRRPPWWVILLVAIPILLVRASDIAALTTEGRDQLQDYLGVHALIDRQDPYTPYTHEQIVAAGTDPALTTPLNAHPPTALVLFLPFAAGSFPTAVVGWSIASVLVFVAGWWLATRELERGWLVWLTPLFALWFPLVLHLRFGQWSALLFLGLTAGWIGLRRGDDRLAGIAFALCTLVKVFPAVLIVLLIVRRRWDAVRWMIGTCVMGAAAVGLWRPDAAVDFVNEVLRANVVQTSFGNASVQSFVTKVFAGSSSIRPFVDQPGLVPIATKLAIVLVVAAVAYVLWRTRDIDLQFSTVVVAMLLLSPVTWVHSFVILLLPGLILATRPTVRRSPVLVASLALVFLLTCVDHWHLHLDLDAARGDELYAPWVHLSAPGFSVLVAMLALNAIVAAREARAPTDRPDRDVTAVPDVGAVLPTGPRANPA